MRASSSFLNSTTTYAVTYGSTHTIPRVMQCEIAARAGLLIIAAHVVLDGSGWPRVALDGSGWLWMALDGSGWLWMAQACFGWLWLALDDSTF